MSCQDAKQPGRNRPGCSLPRWLSRAWVAQVRRLRQRRLVRLASLSTRSADIRRVVFLVAIRLGVIGRGPVRAALVWPIRRRPPIRRRRRTEGWATLARSRSKRRASIARPGGFEAGASFGRPARLKARTALGRRTKGRARARPTIERSGRTRRARDEAVPAIDRPTRTRLERNLRRLAARRANGRIHLTLRAIESRGWRWRNAAVQTSFVHGAAFRAAAGLVVEALLRVEFLLANGKGKGTATVATGKSLIS